MKKGLKNLISKIAIFMFVIMLFPKNADALTFKVDRSVDTIKPGGEVTVYIKAEDVTNDSLNAYTVSLTYDSSKLEYKKYDLKNRIEKLVHKFSNFNCFLSKYYIENLNGVLSKIAYLENLDNDDYIYDVTEKLNNFDDALLDKAKKIIHDEPFHFKHGDMYDRTITADEAADTIREKLKQLGYDWHIIMRENMLPRMGVNPEKTFRIKPSAKFSKIDIESLIVHEIKAHVAKRYYGYQLGLFLFVFGLSGKNMFDEGLAIWNTFNMLDTPKPNARFNIAISYLVCYYCCKYDFCDAFDKIKELVKDADYSDFTIF